MFEDITTQILQATGDWEPKLTTLTEHTTTTHRNDQGRTIKQITGHMVDSATNNTHRIIHLQYQQSPLIYPDYAHDGNNNRWIVIQNYLWEDWSDLVALWKYSNLHLVHVIRNVHPHKLESYWRSGDGCDVTLRTMIEDYPRHLLLHLSEIEELMNRD